MVENRLLTKQRQLIYALTPKGLEVRRKTSQTWQRKNPEAKKIINELFKRRNPENHRVRRVMSGDGAKYNNSIKKDISAMRIYIKKLENKL